jgi:hypothetical protein
VGGPSTAKFNSEENEGNDGKRSIFINDTEYDRHVLRHKSRRFARDFQWMSTRYRYRTRKMSSSLAYVASSQHDNPTVRDLRNAGDHAVNGVVRDRLKTEMEHIMGKLISYGGKV